MVSLQAQGGRALGRRPSNIPDDLASSNSTLNAFVGGRQKSWMTGGLVPNISNNTFTNYRRPTAPQTTQQPSTAAVAQEPNRQNSVFQALPQNAPTRTGFTSNAQELSGSNSPAVANFVPQTPTFFTPIPDLVLPSPAPSDETRFHAPSDETRFHAPTDETRFHAPTDETRFHAPTDETRFHAPTDETRFHAPSPVTTTHHRVSSSTSTASLGSNHRNEPRRSDSLDSSQQRKRTRVINSVSADNGATMPPLALSSNGTLYPQPSASPSQDTQPGPASLKYFLGPLDLYITSVGGPSALEQQVEAPRIKLLQDACNNEDLFYLVLHQIFCLSDFSPDPLTKLGGFGREHFLGISHVSQLLISNENLPQRTLSWGSRFPALIETSLNVSPDYKAAFFQVKNCLFLLLNNWEALSAKCAARSYPPLVDELVADLGIQSIVFQRVAFTGMYRRVWRPANSLGPRLDEIFMANQNQWRQMERMRFDGNPPSPTIVQTANQQLVTEYQKVRLDFHRDQNRRQASTAQVVPSNGEFSVNTANTYQEPYAQASGGATFSRFAPPVFGRPDLSPASQQSPPMPSTFLNVPAPPPNQTFPMAPSPLNQTVSMSSLPSPVVPSPQTQTGLMPSPPVARRRGRPPNLTRPQAVTQQVPARRGRPPMPGPSAAQQTNQNMYFVGQNGRVSAQIPHGPIQAAYQQQYMPNPNAQPSNNLVPPNKALLLPLLEYPNPPRTPPHPHETALHQSHLRSPPFHKRNLQGLTDPHMKLYTYPRGFALAPQHLGTSNPAFRWTFHVAIADFQRKAIDVASDQAASMTRVILDGGVIYRLRCVKLSSPNSKLEESEWTITDNAWPATFYPKINGTHLELRRKFHHGKDLPVDLTPHIRAGINELEISFLRTEGEQTTTFYAVAVESIQVASQERVRGKVSAISTTDSLSSITASLNLSADDEDIQIVDDHISIGLMDPFTAKIFDVPVRGKTCLHRECFDLETFLATRKSKRRDGPTMPDEWRCPICGLDARPQSLVVDEFLQHVRTSLEDTHQLEARAILVKQDGSWEAKAMPQDPLGEPGGMEGMEGGSLFEHVHGLGNSLGANVIDLDGDD
jgi:MIZ/SP-RING zinc finger